MTLSRIIAVILFLMVCALHALAPSSMATTYVYDQLNRLIAVTYDDNTSISYTYDEVGNRIERQAGNTPIFSISVSSGTGGTVQPSSTALFYGESQTFSITPNSDYRIDEVKVDGISVGAISSYSFSNVTADHTLQVNFAKAPFLITTSVSGNGTITPESPRLSQGENRTFSITPNTGNHIVDVSVDGVSQGAITSYTFTNVTADHTISATFSIDTFTISASAGTNGSISPSGQTTVDYGTSLTFSITPATGYHVADVTVDGASQGAITSYTFSNVTAAHTISATFAIDTLTISASAGTHGSISPSGQVSVDYGTNQTFTVTPATGYHVVDVSVDGASQGVITSYTFSNVTTAHTISATFAIDTFTISASAGAHGSISPSGQVSIDYATTQSFTITPATGYHVADVTVDGASQGTITSYTFNSVTAAHTISATFAIDTFTISASAGTHGSISPSGQVSIDYGTTQTFTVTPDAHYHIAAVSVDGASVGAVTSYSFTNVTAAHSISATFAIDTSSIATSIESGSGTISPASATVDYGGSQTFTITPATNYCLVDVKVDGVSQGAITSYTFSNTTANHTISVLFNAPVKNVTRNAFHETLQAAYDAASTGDVIRVRDIQLAGSLTAGRDISITIDGGYDSTFASNPNKTTIIGAVTINSGTVTMLNCMVSSN